MAAGASSRGASNSRRPAAASPRQPCQACQEAQHKKGQETSRARTAGVHGGHRLLAPQLHQHAPLVVAAGGGDWGQFTGSIWWRSKRNAADAPAQDAGRHAADAAPAQDAGARRPGRGGACTGEALSQPQPQPQPQPQAQPPASPHGQGVGALDVSHRPHALHVVVQRVLQPVAAKSGGRRRGRGRNRS